MKALIEVLNPCGYAIHVDMQSYFVDYNCGFVFNF